jgi:SNF2 family DNA or RNA helicase
VSALTTSDSANQDDNNVVEVPIAVAPALGLLEEAGAAFDDGKVWAQLHSRLARAADVDDVPPRGLRADLRPYQRDGLLFLRRLAAWGFGGVLADDMGLGKTVQAIGLLVDRAKIGPALVVAPTSVAFNWARELERFAPQLNVHMYADATDRKRLLDALNKKDVVICSYGLLDEQFVDATFATAIFDEAQAIKNADTQRARACRDVNADIKIALSGTPLENHLGELWSLYRVVCPGLLGSVEQFRKRFLVPIERDRSVQHRRQLGQTLRPFLLRRTKGEVLTD